MTGEQRIDYQPESAFDFTSIAGSSSPSQRINSRLSAAVQARRHRRWREPAVRTD